MGEEKLAIRGQVKTCNKTEKKKEKTRRHIG